MIQGNKDDLKAFMCDSSVNALLENLEYNSTLGNAWFAAKYMKT